MGVESERQPVGEPRRVLHVIQYMRPEGIQTVVMNLYRHIDRSQLQFDFAVRESQPQFYDEEIRSLGGRLFHLPWVLGNPLSVPVYCQALGAVLRDEGPFVAFHSHTGLHSGYTLPVATMANVYPRVVHSHSAAAAKQSFLRTIWGRLMRRNIQKHATHMLACSSLGANWLYGSGWRQDERVQLFPNAIELDKYANLGNDRRWWRQELDLPLKGPLIGHVGRFDPVKNHAFLLELFGVFRKVCSEAKLILVGEGELKHELMQRVTAVGMEGSVYFLGARSDVPQILAALDLFVFPSLNEGLGMVLVEAQAAGIPCLASDAVAEEVDLGLGLVHFEKIAAGVEKWGRHMLSLLDTKPVSWNKRKSVLQNAGYDVKHGAQMLQELYLSAV